MKDSFPARPSIRSFRQLNEATALIVLLRKQQSDAEAGLESLLKEVRQRYAHHFMTETKHGPVAISERLERLEAAVSKFCQEKGIHNSVSQRMDTPTARLNAFLAVGGIDFKDGHNRRTAAATYAAKEGFRDAIQRLLKRFGLRGRIILMPELDWDGLKRSLRDGSLTPQEIAPLGMIWTGGEKTKITTKRIRKNEGA